MAYDEKYALLTDSNKTVLETVSDMKSARAKAVELIKKKMFVAKRPTVYTINIWSWGNTRRWVGTVQCAVNSFYHSKSVREARFIWILPYKKYGVGDTFRGVSEIGNLTKNPVTVRFDVKV